MEKKYQVTLTPTEQQELQELIARRSAKAAEVKRAYILLATDENGTQQWPDATISSTYQVGVRTVERVRQRFVELGLQSAVYGKKREVYREKVFDGEVEAHLVALRCSEPPSGRAHWTLHLLAERMVELHYVESISHESVRQLLKKQTQAVACQKLVDS
ncbi:MAG TPA: helix-turn-helix domain-containing protein [Anaerolineae bacterium]|nr:helix-turn-helix domain-containing protein [Anaerolineae bacterium]HQK15758.1 helix-turn-helix domain-containing protein [Anaerolineae bacterium]